MASSETALIVGAGPGLSASLARRFAKEDIKVAIAARNTDKLSDLVAQSGAKAYACDAMDPPQVADLFGAVTSDLGEPDIVVYNASNRARGPITDGADVARAVACGADAVLVDAGVLLNADPQAGDVVEHLRQAMATCGYTDLKAFQKAEVVVR